MSAFVELVLTKGYEVVSARDIARKANVGRSTFYLHFASKGELLKESLKFPSRALAGCVSGDLGPQQLVRLLDHFREQRDLNRPFFADPIRALWVKCLAASIQPHLVARPPSGPRPQVPRSLIALTIAEMQIALITHWITGRVAVRTDVMGATLMASTRAMVSEVAPL